MLFRRLFTSSKETSSPTDYVPLIGAQRKNFDENYKINSIACTNADGDLLRCVKWSSKMVLVKKFTPVSTALACQQIISHIKKFKEASQSENMLSVEQIYYEYKENKYFLYVEYSTGTNDEQFRTFADFAKQKNRKMGFNSNVTMLRTMRVIVHMVKSLHDKKLVHNAITMANVIKDKSKLAILGDAIHSDEGAKAKDLKQLGTLLASMSETLSISTVLNAFVLII